MPRRKLVRQNHFPYHITTRTNNKDWFNIPLHQVWDIFKEALISAQQKNSVQIHCMVLMSNHYHLLISTPNSDIDMFMKHLNLKFSQLLGKASGRINHKFSNRYKWCIVDQQNYLLNVYRYIYQNPVRAGLTNDCSRYPYSSIHLTSFEAKLINYEPHLIYGKEKSWMERQFGCDFDLVIRNGLKNKVFKPNVDINTHTKKILNNPKKLSYLNPDKVSRTSKTSRN